MSCMRQILFCCWAAGLAMSTSVHASEFFRVCDSSMAKAAQFAVDCKKNARSLRREFFPGGHGEPVPELHAAWFDAPDHESHFGFGCTLGSQGEIRFLGLYYAFKPANFRQANTRRSHS